MAAGTVNRDALGRFVSRLEMHYDERKEVNDTIRGVYDEIREAGMHPETVRQMVREKALDPVIRQDQYDLRDQYRRALGLYADTELGKAMEPPAETMTKPRPFADQTVHPPRRTRKRKTVDDAFAEARAHLEGEPAGTA
ncbi:MAG TPA: GapR family DNA-binding domain-containing protein [Xanthobacteraceae bacterium]|nr:GapR family DNA-binding domain-containing protein [Xanthobacteraceae bacterium]